MSRRTVNAQALIRALDLQSHVEGGYFRRTYQADHREMLDTWATAFWRDSICKCMYQAESGKLRD
jgi:predicted cupin superfamily sugar epimerase